MPATTRSKSTPKQTHLEDFESKTTKANSKDKADSSKSKHSTTPKPKKETKHSSKRKHPDGEESAKHSARPVKKQKEYPVVINRAPVLQLWAACVSEALYADLPWSTHLSIGSAISTLCAVSKGRAIGTIEQPSDDPDKQAEKDSRKRAAEEGATDEVNVMRFKLHLKDGEAIVSGKPKKGSDGPLKAKFGEENYERVKKAMEEAIDTWKVKKGLLAHLDNKAFHMYEQFRPNVQSGQGGWGKKGELRLEKVREVVTR